MFNLHINDVISDNFTPKNISRFHSICKDVERVKHQTLL